MVDIDGVEHNLFYNGMDTPEFGSLGTYESN